MLYTDSQVPKVVEDALERMANFSLGLRITELISQTACELQKALADGSRSNPFNVEDEELTEHGQMTFDEEVSDEEVSDFDWPQSPIHDFDGASPSNTFTRISSEAAAKLNKRIREDIRSVRDAGFKFGILRGMKADSHTSVLSISVQIAHLGLSDEAITAWDLQKQQYVVLLIRYSAGYKTFEAIINDPARSHEIEFRIGISKRYKPTVAEAMAAFTTLSKTKQKETEETSATDEPQIDLDESPAGFSSLFISSSLNEFMKEQFTSLLKIRYNLGIDWDEAKHYYGDRQSRIDAYGVENDYRVESTSPQNRPYLVTADHILDSKDGKYSFPLIAMQFVLRHLTRCTEFCLVCHDKTGSNFEALKPYVCSKPLCLYQVSILVPINESKAHKLVTVYVSWFWTQRRT